jgi:hypothetical protein
VAEAAVVGKQENGSGVAGVSAAAEGLEVAGASRVVALLEKNAAAAAEPTAVEIYKNHSYLTSTTGNLFASKGEVFDKAHLDTKPVY